MAGNIQMDASFYGKSESHQNEVSRIKSCDSVTATLCKGAAWHQSDV